MAAAGLHPLQPLPLQLRKAGVTQVPSANVRRRQRLRLPQQPQLLLLQCGLAPALRQNPRSSASLRTRLLRGAGRGGMGVNGLPGSSGSQQRLKRSGSARPVELGRRGPPLLVRLSA